MLKKPIACAVGMSAGYCSRYLSAARTPAASARIAAPSELFYDADGSGEGEALLIVTLKPGTELNEGDFLII